MNYQEFATTVRAKYPGSYDHVDDITLSRKIIEKHPEYAPKVTFDEQTAQPSQPRSVTPSLFNKTASAIYRPILEVGGSVGGGLLGAPAGGPIGAAAGGALGYAAGKSAADLADRYMGVKPMIQNFPQALKETGQNALQGAEFEATNLVAGPIIKKLLNNPVTRKIGDVAATAGQWATNIPSRDYKTLFKNPEGILPGSLERASSQYSQASRAAGIPEELTPEQLDNVLGPKARRIVKDVYAKIFEGGKVTAAEAQNAKQMLDAVYPNPTAKNGKLLHALDTVRDAFQGVISSESPALRDANKSYAIAKAGSKFKSIFPKTLTSRPEFVRSGLLGTLALHNPVGAAALTPIGQGVMTAGAGAAYKGAQAIASNPVLTAPIANKVLDEMKAREFLKQANGDKSKASLLATEAGYSF